MGSIGNKGRNGPRLIGLARIVHIVSWRGAAKARMARRLKRFRNGLYGDILSGEEREANAARRACSQPQQKGCEISGLDQQLFQVTPGCWPDVTGESQTEENLGVSSTAAEIP